MKTTFTIYRVGRPVETGEVDWPVEPGYFNIKNLVEPILDGKHLEHVTVFHEGQYTDMFVDETGQLDNLPVNPDATAIYRNNVLVHVPGTKPEDMPDIRGTAIVFSRKVWF